MDKAKLLLAQNDPKFIMSLGLFHAAWTSIDLTLDCAIGKSLETQPEQTHLVTAGMEMGRKIRLLHGIVGRTNHKNKNLLIGALNRLQNESKRSVLTHSYILSDRHVVTFVERIGGEYRVRLHKFTVDEFAMHVQKFTQAAKDFWDALEYTDRDIYDFAMAAVKQANS